MEVQLTKEEKDAIFRLNQFLGVNLPLKEAKTSSGSKKILLEAWRTDDRTLHNGGFSRQRIASLCSRLSGFNRFIFRRSCSIYAALGS
jgi:hypothetical protein